MNGRAESGGSFNSNSVPTSLEFHLPLGIEFLSQQQQVHSDPVTQQPTDVWSKFKPPCKALGQDSTKN